MSFSFTPDNPVEPHWGTAVQPERLAACVRYTPKGAQILDLGAGRGAYTEELSRSGFPTVGVDIQWYPAWQMRDLGDFVTASGAILPFRNKAFHTTIAFEVLEHCPDPEGVLREILRCTSQRLILSVPNCDLENALRRYDLAMAHWTDATHCSFFTKESIGLLLKAVGCEIVEISDCYRISPNDYFWDTLRVPRPIAVIMKKTIQQLRLAEEYWSSILVVADIPQQGVCNT